MNSRIPHEYQIVAAFQSFEWKRGKQNEPQLKADSGMAHAVLQYPGYYSRVRLEVKEPVYLDGQGDGERALCGANMRVLLPMEFNGQDPDACPQCVEALSNS